MGGSAGGALAAAVSNAGGLGLVGGGRGAPEWLDAQLRLVSDRTENPWGVGFLTWAVPKSTVHAALAYRPAAVMLSFGDPTPFVNAIRDAEVTLLLQVTDPEEARQAIGLRPDAVIAQGTEAGGHGALRGHPTLPFLRKVLEMAEGIPVLAAGGIVDGRGLAGALASGAAGALIGTRFLATPEALVDPAIRDAVVRGRGEDTVRTRVHDILQGTGWPAEYSARTLQDVFTERWRETEGELEERLATDHTPRRDYQEAVSKGTVPPQPAWASNAIDAITEIAPAADIVERITSDAQRLLDTEYVQQRRR